MLVNKSKTVEQEDDCSAASNRFCMNTGEISAARFRNSPFEESINVANTSPRTTKKRSLSALQKLIYFFVISNYLNVSLSLYFSLSWENSSWLE